MPETNPDFLPTTHIGGWLRPYDIQNYASYTDSEKALCMDFIMKHHYFKYPKILKRLGLKNEEEK